MFRICLVSNSAWSIYNFRIDVIRHFIKKGYEVLVLAADDEYAALLQQEGCCFVPVNFNNRTENPFSDYLLFLQLKCGGIIFFRRQDKSAHPAVSSLSGDFPQTTDFQALPGKTNQIP